MDDNGQSSTFNLASLRERNLNRIEKVQIERMHLLSDDPMFCEYEWAWNPHPTQPKKDTELVPPPVSTRELERAMKARERLRTMYANGQRYQSDEESVNSQMSMDEESDIGDGDQQLTMEDMDGWTLAELKAKCKKLGLKVSGVKKVLKERILDPDNPVHKPKKGKGGRKKKRKFQF